MASGPLVGGDGGGGGGGDGSRQKDKWSCNKVYTRKVRKKLLNPNSDPNPNPLPPPPQPETLESIVTTTTTATATNTATAEENQNPLLERLLSPVCGNRADSNEKGDEKSDRDDDNHNSQVSPGDVAQLTQSNGHGPFISHRIEGDGQHMVVVNLAYGSTDEALELRTQLREELDRVRASYRMIEALELELARTPVLMEASVECPVPVEIQQDPMKTPTAYPVSTVTSTVYPVPIEIPSEYNHAQFSTIEGRSLLSQNASIKVPPLRRHLNVQVENYSPSDITEKEKRTPKANKYYRNEDFLLAKDKFPPQESHKKPKANGKKDNGTAVVDKIYAHAFKGCSALLAKLMKHKHGWVFNNPVDVNSLGLHDYYIIIKHPMDLGTIKSRLCTNWYKTPREFAEDVRLTFRNAMTYNPKGQDVHVMAEQLLNIFEERWPTIEAEFTLPSYATLPKKVRPPPLDMRGILEKSESMKLLALPSATPKSSSYTPYLARTPALKKPKAKDLNKREMTFEEKQKLSINLQNLPSEKLDIVLEIIKRRNSALSQHENEIEVDIDIVDTETLWELDRFVTNYKKSLSKHKRRAELAMARKIAEQKIHEQNAQVEAPTDTGMQTENRTNESHVASFPNVGEQKGNNDSRSSSSSSSSSDSGSSSSDSDSESSSG